MGTKARGTTITYDGSSSVSTVTSLSPPAIEYGDINTTHYGLSDDFRTFEAGLADPGECVVGVEYDDTEFAALYDIAGESKDWVITFPDGSSITFSGYIKGMPLEVPDADDDEIMRLEFTIKVSGKPTFIEG